MNLECFLRTFSINSQLTIVRDKARKRSGTNIFSQCPMSAWSYCGIDIWCGPVSKCRPTDEQMGWWKTQSSRLIRSSSSTSCRRHFLVLKNNHNGISIQLSNWFICLLKKLYLCQGHFKIVVQCHVIKCIAEHSCKAVMITDDVINWWCDHRDHRYIARPG